MTELEKIICASFATGVVGYLVGRVQAWHTYRRDDKIRRMKEIESFEKDYIERESSNKNFDSFPKYRIPICRMKVLQELGAYRFSKEELERIHKSIMARGFADPLCAHKEILGSLDGYPYSVFEWAKLNHVNLGSSVSVLEKWISLHKSWESDERIEQSKKMLEWQVMLEIDRKEEAKSF